MKKYEKNMEFSDTLAKSWLPLELELPQDQFAWFAVDELWFTLDLIMANHAALGQYYSLKSNQLSTWIFVLNPSGDGIIKLLSRAIRGRSWKIRRFTRLV